MAGSELEVEFLDVEASGYPGSPDSVVAIAPSREDAFDWSLALASQSIESSIDANSDRSEWRVRIPSRDRDRARRELRLFQAELVRDRESRLKRTEIPSGGADFKWFHPALMGWGLYLIVAHAQARQTGGWLKDVGMMDSTRVADGDWGRLFTAMSLHSDTQHLVSNLVGGTLFLGMAASGWGIGRALLFAFLAGALGNLLGFLVYAPPHLGLGASGMVFGGLGLSLVSPNSPMISENRWRPAFAATVMLFALFGLNPESDIVAHFGGLMGGVVIGWVGKHWVRGEVAETEWMDALALVVLGGLVIWSWMSVFQMATL